MTPSEDVRKPYPNAFHPAHDRPGTYPHERYLQEQLRRRTAMAPDRAITPDHVRDVILQDLDRRTGQNGRWEVEFAREARESWLFRAHTPLSPHPLAVKVYSSAMPAKLAVRQLQVLRHYHAAMASRPGLTVPAPWAALPEHRTLIMEWVDELRVDELLKRARTRPERNRVIAAAGHWLRHFHDQGEQSVQPLKDIDLLRSLRTLLGSEDGDSARDPVFRAACGVLQDNLRELGDTRIPFVMAHGDFSPANLFHGPRRTVGFDFKANTARPPARDILHFLVYARSFNTPAWMRLTPQLDQRDLDSFLSAYGPLGEAVDQRLITVFRLAETLHSWAHLLDRTRREGVNVRHKIRAWRLRSMARHAAASLERASGG